MRRLKHTLRSTLQKPEGDKAKVGSGFGRAIEMAIIIAAS